jgi:glycosyltransferase involved in cell wall biosynthesis
MISIVTINLNNRSGLDKTLFSLQIQHAIVYELNVIDGDSTDGSFEIIKKYCSLINNLVLEKDTGVYNAMNKGIKKSKQDFILFLNSGDTLYNQYSLNNLTYSLKEFDIVYGNVLDLGKCIPDIVCYPEILTFNYMLCGGLPHQATVIRRILFDKIGLYHEKYKIISDWVFFMEALFIHNASFKHIPNIISSYEGGGISSLSSNTKLIISEQIDYISNRFPSSLTYFYLNSPYVKRYLRQKPRIVRWFFRLFIFRFNKVY